MSDDVRKEKAELFAEQWKVVRQAEEAFSGAANRVETERKKLGILDMDLRGCVGGNIQERYIAVSGNRIVRVKWDGTKAQALPCTVINLVRTQAEEKGQVMEHFLWGLLACGFTAVITVIGGIAAYYVTKSLWPKDGE